MDIDIKSISHTPSQSSATQVQIVLPQHANSQSRLFGGILMQWIDIVAGVVGRRHAGCEVTTACIDHLVFEQPAFVGDTIQINGIITYVGTTSMEVRVDTFVEKFGTEVKRINRAFLSVVAVDENGRPKSVPKLEINTEQEIREWNAAKRRKQLRLERRQEKY